MANLLVHALFALALSSISASLVGEGPLSGGAFVAAFVALLPDVELGRGGRRTPYGHSLAYTALWILVALSGLSVATHLGVLPGSRIMPLFFALLVGLGSHLLLDAFSGPGIFSWPSKGGKWGRIRLLQGRVLNTDLLATGLSGGTLLLLLVVY